MIGTGVFTSLGFQLIDIQSAPVIMMLWLVGGVSALCGAQFGIAQCAANSTPHSGGIAGPNSTPSAVETIHNDQNVKPAPRK